MATPTPDMHFWNLVPVTLDKTTTMSSEWIFVKSTLKWYETCVNDILCNKFYGALHLLLWLQWKTKKWNRWDLKNKHTRINTVKNANETMKGKVKNSAYK